jgi:hypothetical protein
MDPLHDPRCLVTTEALFLDGANGVCGTPRQSAGEGPPALALLTFILVLAVAITVRTRSRLLARRTIVMATVALALAALPGLWAILALRADRPTDVATSASRVARAHHAVHAFAREHRGAVLRTQTEISIVPIARLALIGVSHGGVATSAPPAAIDLFDDTLEDGCRVLGDSLVCGTRPP